MIPVRLKQYLDFGERTGIIWRDIHVPTIVPGMKFANIFGLPHDPCGVEAWEYDADAGHFVAWLEDDLTVEEKFTFEELAEKGDFLGWDTSQFSTASAESAPDG